MERDKRVLEHLEQFISLHRKEVVQKVLSQRTRYITIVLEDIFQSQNTSAVIRTAECMGLQDIHLIQQRTKYQINPGVLRGANKWMDFHHYNDPQVNNTEECYKRLRGEGYAIYVTDPDPQGVSIHNLSIETGKMALVFGNELHGASEYAIRNADQKINIPMYGFTESLNLSVSVAISLNTLTTKLRSSSLNVGLSEEEIMKLKLDWYRKIVRGSDLIESEFLRTIK